MMKVIYGLLMILGYIFTGAAALTLIGVFFIAPWVMILYACAQMPYLLSTLICGVVGYYMVHLGSTGER